MKPTRRAVDNSSSSEDDDDGSSGKWVGGTRSDLATGITTPVAGMSSMAAMHAGGLAASAAGAAAMIPRSTMGGSVVSGGNSRNSYSVTQKTTTVTTSTSDGVDGGLVAQASHINPNYIPNPPAPGFVAEGGGMTSETMHIHSSQSSGGMYGGMGGGSMGAGGGAASGGTFVGEAMHTTVGGSVGSSGGIVSGGMGGGMMPGGMAGGMMPGGMAGGMMPGGVGGGMISGGMAGGTMPGGVGGGMMYGGMGGGMKPGGVGGGMMSGGMGGGGMAGGMAGGMVVGGGGMMSGGGSVIHKVVTNTTTMGMGGGMGAVMGGGMAGQHISGSSTTVTGGAIHPPVPVDCKDIKYELNKDLTPDIITMHPDQTIKYDQNVSIRYLKPPTPPPVAPIVIREVRPAPLPEAEPLYIKLRPQRPKTPPPLIIRERPPMPPLPVAPKIIDKVLPPAPPPPRKVIIEKLAPLPPKPQQVIIEKWLPYQKVKREIIYQKAADLPAPKQVKNTIIQWCAPDAEITTKYHNLGVVRADPIAYMSHFANQLTDSYGVSEMMNKFGALLHFKEAAYSNQRPEDLYVEDHGEINRLLSTDFHPNELNIDNYYSTSGSGGGGGGVYHHQQAASSGMSDWNSSSVYQQAMNMYSDYCQNSQVMQGPPPPCMMHGGQYSSFDPSGLSSSSGVYWTGDYAPPCSSPCTIAQTIMAQCEFAPYPGHSMETCEYCQHAMSTYQQPMAM